MATKVKKAPAKKAQAKTKKAAPAPIIKQPAKQLRKNKPDPKNFVRKYHAEETMPNGVVRKYYNNNDGVECMELVMPGSDNARVTQRIGDDGRVYLDPK